MGRLHIKSIRLNILHISICGMTVGTMFTYFKTKKKKRKINKNFDIFPCVNLLLFL